MTRRISALLLVLLLLMALAGMGLSATAESSPVAASDLTATLPPADAGRTPIPPPVTIHPTVAYPFPPMPVTHLPIVVGYPYPGSYPEANP
jgi:hypothetical protein